MNPLEEFYIQEGHDKEAKVMTKDNLLSAASIVGVPIASMAALEGYDAVKDSIHKARGFKKMMDTDDEIKQKDSDTVKKLYNSVYNVSPTVAKDPFAAASVINRMADYEGKVDFKTLSELANAERSIGGGAAMSPIRQNTINTLTREVGGRVGNPLYDAQIREKRLKSELTEGQLGKMDEELQRARESHQFQAARQGMRGYGQEDLESLRQRSHNDKSYEETLGDLKNQGRL